MNVFSQLTNMPSLNDPDDARRRRLLNILLTSVAVLTVLSLAVTFYSDIRGLLPEYPRAIYLGGLIALPGLAIIFLINRYLSGTLASSIFLVLLVFSFSVDKPEEVVAGRTLFMFAIPILMASAILRPYASFIMAGFVGVLNSAIALQTQQVPNIIATVAFFAIALVAWLAARNLEDALKELRKINAELDQRVADRTRELSQALTREQIESSKNQAILQGIADGVMVFDDKDVAVVANPAIGGLLQRPVERITGNNIETLMGQNVKEPDQEMIVGLLKNHKQASSAKLQWGYKTLSVSFAPVRDREGGITGTVAVFRDFTREAEIDRMKSTFASIASHELRTPLNAIMGYAEMLQNEIYGNLSDQQRSVIDRLIANTAQLLSLANNLLDQAQIEAGKLNLNYSSFAPSDLVDAVSGVMNVIAHSKGLALKFHIADDMPDTLSGDSPRLQQILINLINNSIKFTEQGTISIRIYHSQPAQWVLEVSDTGRGIPAEARSYIFDPFRQVDSSATRKQKGVGLGLSIVKQIVELMNGTISLDSLEGRGSTFTVVLPLTTSITSTS